MSKNKTFYVGKGSGSIIFNFQAAAAVERKKGELCLLKVLCGMNSFRSGMNSFQIEIMENCGDKVRNEFIPDRNEFIPVNFFS